LDGVFGVAAMKASMYVCAGLLFVLLACGAECLVFFFELSKKE
jgi:hypothetical protein